MFIKCVVEMRMLKWLGGNNIRQDRILKEKICLQIGVTLIYGKMKEGCLRWFDHVHMRAINVPMRNNEMIQIERTKKGGKNRERPKITLIKWKKNSCS